MNEATERPTLSLSKTKQTRAEETSSPKQDTHQAKPKASSPKAKATTNKPVHPPSPILQCFRKHWPTLFDGRHVVPLQIGILDDITRHLAQAGEPFDKKQIAKALGIHCRRVAYMVALTKAPCRMGLNEEQTPISDEDREHAKRKLKELFQAKKGKEKNSPPASA